MGRVVRSLMHGWNVFKDAPLDVGPSAGAGSAHSYRQARSPARYFSDRSFITSILTRMAVDSASIEFYHALLDPVQDIPVEVVHDPLNDCLTLDPNLDQTAFHMKLDAFATMFQIGHCVIFPTDATMDPLESGSYDIKNMRVGRVVDWYPRDVRIEGYDDRTHDDAGNPVPNPGTRKQFILPKKNVVIVENPWYDVMNEPSGAFQRLQRKLAILDGVDEAAGSGKLDLIMQLPYGVRGDSRKKQAEDRKKELYDQLKDDELGIGWIDVSEKVIQLNRPVNNKLLEEILELQKAVYTELGITAEIMNGTASLDQINTYYDRTIEPGANAMALEYKRKFLTKTARTQRHSVEIYRDPLKLIPITELADIADSLSRNAVITSNEFRPKIGFMPSKDPLANKLRNPNMPDDDQGLAPGQPNAKVRPLKGVANEELSPGVPDETAGA